MSYANLSIDDPGAPEVDPSTLDDDELLDDLEGDELVDAGPVDEAVVRGLVKAAGAGLHVVAGDPEVPEHWQFTDRELDDLTPPLTRYINRRPRLRAAVARGDEWTVAVVLASYGGRNLAAGQSARRRRAERERQAGRATGAARPDAGWMDGGGGPNGTDRVGNAAPDGGGLGR